MTLNSAKWWLIKECSPDHISISCQIFPFFKKKKKTGYINMPIVLSSLKCPLQNAMWAHLWDPTLWMYHIGQTADYTQASPPPCPLRRTQLRVGLQRWPPSLVEKLLHTEITSAGATQVTAVLSGGAPSTPAAGLSQSIECTPRTSQCRNARSGMEDVRKWLLMRSS